ncbi:MAG: DUF4350 domain-containing protein [Methanocalculus sp. MSAO_Arc2]|uniref:DUF4350 domain-containing protein n=1 Tax=Methanocalculus sp. MSAO_Arc2 TaxID=2293855 RepID=UPI000FF07544|nr:MAG: DUF4350 domain-containing protein [Methanocalculus sp. MSAO_Arc2]
MRPPLFIAAIIILLTLGAAGVHLQATTADLSRFNPGWSGTAAFYSHAESMGASIHTPGTVIPADTGRYIIIAPRDAGAIEEVNTVLANGGTVIIADEEGGSDALLMATGCEMRVIPGNLSSVDMEFNTPRTIMAQVRSDHTLFFDVETLVFNRPAYIEGGEPLVKSSVLSWVDVSGDGRPGPGEPLDRYTLIAREEVGAGDVILIADASLFTTTMQQVRQLQDNKQLLDNLLSHERTVVDAVYGRPADADGPAYYVHTITSAPISTIILILLLMVFVAAAFRKKIL